ncbi:formate dehydrogenase [Noviherbaspirillum sp. CPCC 100848]|uniref:Formate dehydrogenase n=1 Tax=Noviherbaspirillum album TaxID=3080276 RepID=A0ABU6J357_9BURK|nr:formate dehydrogenase [Noviherbaspirillum sp. CPCC 100848]MEC4717861.1 formate dehydrogenase [Noviherbaspirillum sp. CPCC 100848]
MKMASHDAKRRIFLTAAACAPVVAVAALITRTQSAPEVLVPEVSADKTAGSVGYHETEHIRKYYRSAAYF